MRRFSWRRHLRRCCRYRYRRLCYRSRRLAAALACGCLFSRSSWAWLQAWLGLDALGDLLWQILGGRDPTRCPLHVGGSWETIAAFGGYSLQGAPLTSTMIITTITVLVWIAGTLLYDFPVLVLDCRNFFYVRSCFWMVGTICNISLGSVYPELFVFTIVTVLDIESHFTNNRCSGCAEPTSLSVVTIALVMDIQNQVH